MKSGTFSLKSRECLFSDPDKGYELLGVSAVPDKSWNSLTRYLRLEWFKRAWVALKIVRGRKILIFCGSFQVAWADLYLPYTFLSLSQWSIRLAERANTRNPIARAPFAWSESKAGIEEGGRSAKINLLNISLIAARQGHPTHPRDKVFSVLGFTTPSTLMTPKQR
jgi:hypothetical protein